MHRVKAKADLVVQNAKANACAFACVTSVVPGCKGFNFYSVAGLRDQDFDDNGQKLTLRTPVLPNICELYSQTSVDASPMTPDVDPLSGGVVFYKALK